MTQPFSSPSSHRGLTEIWRTFSEEISEGSRFILQERDYFRLEEEKKAGVSPPSVTSSTESTTYRPSLWQSSSSILTTIVSSTPPGGAPIDVANGCPPGGMELS